MGIVISLDTGAAFTDAVAIDGKKGVWAKVETTHRNPKMCFTRCLQALGQKLKLSLIDMLAQTTSIRWSFSLAHELIMRRDKSSVGIIVSGGFEKNICSTDYLSSMIPAEMVVGIREEKGGSGQKMENGDREEIGEAIRHLVERGALDIVVSLRGFFHDNVRERDIREVAHLEYPAHYLGSPELFLSSEGSDNDDESQRRNAAIVNAYLHRDVARYVSALEDAVHDGGYKLPINVGRSTAEVSQVHQTSALGVCHSSAAGAAAGCADLLDRLYGLGDFICMDVGGSSLAHISLVCGNEVSMTTHPVIAGIPVSVPMIRVHTAAGGSGAVAWVKPDESQIAVGPQSAAVSPKAAAYNRQGTEATVMDAQIVLGCLDPDNFFGGHVRLEKDKAVEAVRSRIAARVGMSVEEAAYAIVKRAENNIVQAIQQALDESQAKADSMALVAFGGAAGGLCCGCAAALGIKRIICFSFNPVASAVLALTGKEANEEARGIALSERFSYEHPEHDKPGALKGTRAVYWGQGFLQTDIYRQNLLTPETEIAGPAVIETAETTYLIAPGWIFRVDAYLNGEMEVCK